MLNNINHFKGFLSIFFTFKQRADFPPAGDSTLTGVLTQCCLQEENRNPTGKQENEVGDKKGS